MTLKTISLKVKKEEYEDIEDSVASGHFVSKSEFIREAIRHYYDKKAEKVIKDYEKNPDRWIDWEDAKKRLRK